jgi:hypothetical protein
MKKVVRRWREHLLLLLVVLVLIATAEGGVAGAGVGVVGVAVAAHAVEEAASAVDESIVLAAAHALAGLVALLDAKRRVDVAHQLRPNLLHHLT